MGSASTGIACINLNRNFIGMEKYDDNYDVALNRILDKMQDEEKEIFLSTYRNPIREELK
jgi:site-specific DNA-methyltransferase (adenine-specific)